MAAPAPEPQLRRVCRQAWEPVLARARRAVVFLDAASAEALHWGGGGAGELLAAGALAVRALPAEPEAAAGAARAVFVVSGALRGGTAAAVRGVLGQGAVRHCVLVSGGEAEGGGLAELEETLRRWMGEGGRAEVVPRGPPLLAPVSAELCLLPALAALLPPLPGPGGPGPAEVGPAALPAELRAAVRALVGDLDALFTALGLREESFAVGALSRVIAAELASYAPARNRRRTAVNKASVVFVDRTLDFAGAVGHHGDNLAEKILSVLPKLPGHKTDVMVNMVELTALQTTDETCSIIAPGCLAQPNDPAAKALWESFVNLKQKEAVMEARRHLVEAASRENLPIRMSMGRVTPEQLSSYIQLFRNNLKALENHCGLLQLVLAMVQTLKHPQTSKWDNFLAFERLLLQTIGESEMPSVLNQLLPMIKSYNERTKDDYTCEDFLVLLVYMYSVVGEIRSGKELEAAEEEVKKALVKAICGEPEPSPLLQKITGCDSSLNLTSQKATDAVDDIFQSLRDIARARMHMKQFNSIHNAGSNTHQASYKPLLKQVVEEICNPDRPDPVDIEHMSSGLTDLLKTGFSMFMKVNRPHPGDHPFLIIFMVGGVTVSEVKMVKDLVATRKPGTQVIVLSSALLTPRSAIELLFATDRLQPDTDI
ncbi:sec1 family domain-containing protein 2 [Aquila chrysaetos chrysaetos]|uniref:Sec1 family domain containing 2 n=1 Tax=Aquila chrysaetos chrysaetos TaxID=223781 RepID=A0A663E2K6_AQUCH|nr:sec1 family domain-containing protein 2 [Aquila chrysaetos chrysaetos]XP_029868325.1 sec1 family domain-containing protein 2 [Aquila chrysaetos chrysaetos]